jgi:hypothetical protein
MLTLTRRNKARKKGFLGIAQIIQTKSNKVAFSDIKRTNRCAETVLKSCIKIVTPTFMSFLNTLNISLSII